AAGWQRLGTTTSRSTTSISAGSTRWRAGHRDPPPVAASRSMNPTRPPARWAAVLAATALNATRLAAGARLADGQASRSVTMEAEMSLADARTVFGLPAEWMLGQRLSTVGDVAAIQLRDR